MPDTHYVEAGSEWPCRYTLAKLAELETLAKAAGAKKFGPAKVEKLQQAAEAYQWATSGEKGGIFFRSNK
jgi:hypothetical protein